MYIKEITKDFLIKGMLEKAFSDCDEPEIDMVKEVENELFMRIGRSRQDIKLADKFHIPTIRQTQVVCLIYLHRKRMPLLSGYTDIYWKNC